MKKLIFFLAFNKDALWFDSAYFKIKQLHILGQDNYQATCFQTEFWLNKTQATIIVIAMKKYYFIGYRTI